MHLVAGQLHHYLVARGVLTANSFAEGSYRVATGCRRHRHFIVRRSPGASLFVKQVRSPSRSMQQALQREAALLKVVRERAMFRTMRGIVPRFVDYDAHRHVLVTKWITSGSPCGAAGSHATQPEFAFLVMAASSLARCHRAFERGLGELDPRLFPGDAPAVLEVHHSDLPFRLLGSVAATFQRTLRSDAQVCGTLDDLRANWRPETLVHGDVKLDNCLLTQRRDGLSTTVHLVDWEFADRGDPAWDLAGLFASVIALEGGALGSRSNLAGGLLPDDLCEQVLQAYAKHRFLRGCVNPQFGLRVGKYVGARLIQSSVEYASQGHASAAQKRLWQGVTVLHSVGPPMTVGEVER